MQNVIHLRYNIPLSHAHDSNTTYLALKLNLLSLCMLYLIGMQIALYLNMAISYTQTGGLSRVIRLICKNVQKFLRVSVILFFCNILQYHRVIAIFLMKFHFIALYAIIFLECYARQLCNLPNTQSLFLDIKGTSSMQHNIPLYFESS